ncbi:hypothetical protein ABL78_5695 [Leptomonas seymouri]|uniref:Uncharacterized protein n=1 Tax=Leptomonas seymouri TaxID=5684 RepID=A0A0N1IJL8_LEPSE|nr:hypothetical protein ABL78_5695 [Leptomonas seymouri]|eukprot:KPI85242.1 hypothetical protein ABL78_5695 [Leptomonas seymouri]
MSFVPPPPPGVVVPAPPAVTPATAAAAAPVPPPAKVKPGGVALDMSNLFESPKTGAKRTLPPWERKKKSMLSGASKSATDAPLTPPAKPTAEKPLSLPGQPMQSLVPGVSSPATFKVVAERSYPSQSSLPSSTTETGALNAGLNAPAAVVSKSPIANLATPPLHSSQPPVVSALAGALQPAANTAPGVAPAASLSLPAASSALAASVPARAPAPSLPAAGAPLPATATGAPPPATAAARPQPGNAVEPAAAAAKPSPPLPGSDPTALAASARIVEEALRDMRMHFLTPSHTVVAPHVVFQGKEQEVVVMPLRPVPPKKKTGKSATAKKRPSSTSPAASTTAASGVWYNEYDLRPSPSCNPAYQQRHAVATRAAGASSTRQEWRRAYFQNVDVHRYIARRYFGEPPPMEH